MTKLDNVTPSLTNRDDQDIYFQEARLSVACFLPPLAVANAPVREATLYNIYCWAKDSAVDTKGYARPNFMEQESLPWHFTTFLNATWTWEDYVFAEVVSSGPELSDFRACDKSNALRLSQRRAHIQCLGERHHSAANDLCGC